MWYRCWWFLNLLSAAIERGFQLSRSATPPLMLLWQKGHLCKRWSCVSLTAGAGWRRRQLERLVHVGVEPAVASVIVVVGAGDMHSGFWTFVRPTISLRFSLLDMGETLSGQWKAMTCQAEGEGGRGRSWRRGVQSSAVPRVAAALCFVGFIFSCPADSLCYIEGSRPEWCISSMRYSRGTPFWSETLKLYLKLVGRAILLYILFFNSVERIEAYDP